MATYRVGPYEFLKDRSKWVVRDAGGRVIGRWRSAPRAYVEALVAWEAKGQTGAGARRLVQYLEHPHSGASWVDAGHWETVAGAAGVKRPAPGTAAEDVPARSRARVERRTAGAKADAARSRKQAQGRRTAREAVAAAERAAPPVKVSARDTKRVDHVASLLEAYGDAIRGVPGLDVRPHVLRPSTPGAVAAVERTLGVTLPGDLRAFLLRGLRGFRGSRDDPFAAVGFDFLDARGILEATQTLREAAAHDPDGEHARVACKGVALTHEEPQLVLDGEAMYHFSFRNPLRKVTTGLTRFLEHYLAAGGFASHAFPALWPLVSALVPVKIPPSKNAWVSAYRRELPAFFAAAATRRRQAPRTR